MEEKLLLKISLVVGIAGIVLLYFLSSQAELPAVKSLEGTEEGEKVRISGMIGKVSEKNNTLFIEILNEKIEKTHVVLFKESEEVALAEGDYVEIAGTIEDYQGKKEIVGSKLVKKGGRAKFNP